MKDKNGKFESPYALIRYFLKGSVRIFAVSMVFAAAVSLFDMILPRIISFTVDSVIGTRTPDLPGPVLALIERVGGTEGLRTHPLYIAAAVLITALMAAICRFLFRYLNEVASERFVKRMRDSLYSRITSLPYAWHGRNSTGDIIQRCTSDVETIKVFVSEQLTSLVRVVTLITLAMIFMAGINGTMTLAASVFIPVVVSYSLFFYTKIGGAFEKADTEEGKLSAIAQENLTGVRVVRAFGREKYEQDRFGAQNETYTQFWIRLIRILSYNWVAGDLMTGLQYLLVTVMGTVFCVRGRITPGEFIAFVSYNAMLTWPVRSLGRVISEMSKAHISIDRLIYIMNSPPEDAGDSSVRPPMDADIVFENVSFSYEEGGEEAVNDVSFTIPAGSTVGILGGTGSGKSTLMYLLEKLYKPSSGRITIGGVDLDSIDTAYLRENIGMVQQEPFLFSRSLAENISITSDDVDMEAVRRAAGTADLIDTIDRFPSGFDTFVGERGVTLSGGQKQRTAIAQTVIRGCPIMIFDDSLSSVDAETDARIRAALDRDTGDATVVLISHRLATLMRADRIIVLERGRVAEIGDHAELMALGGIYRRIYDLQLGDEVE